MLEFEESAHLFCVASAALPQRVCRLDAVLRPGEGCET